MVSRFSRIIAAALIVVMMISMVGCYGSFNLTKKVYHWNGTMGDKWINEIMFVVLTAVPVYGGAAFIDAVVLNSIEFWTGKNPVVAENGKSIEFTKDGQTFTITETADGAVVTDASGTVLARSVRTAEGVNVFDGQGSFTGSLTNEQIAANLQ